jgi:hypothetical protein
VDAGLFHAFHQLWISALCNALNSGRLPADYFAMVEKGRFYRRRPGIWGTAAYYTLRDDTEQNNDGHLEVQRLSLYRSELECYLSKANSLTIRQNGPIVAVIEIASWGYKKSRHAVQTFIENATALVRQGANLLIVDLFPPGHRDPNGLHKLIWDEFQEEPFELPLNKPLTLAAYVAGVPTVAHVEPVAVGDLLPDMPLYLDPVTYVPVPLEATYQATWGSCPKAMREAVERGSPSVTQ